LSVSRNQWVTDRVLELCDMPVKGLSKSSAAIKFGQVFHAFADAGACVFIVGGAVRDLLQGDASGIADIDMAIDMSAQAMVAFAKQNGWVVTRFTKFGMLAFGDRDGMCSVVPSLSGWFLMFVFLSCVCAATPNLEAKCIAGLNSDRVRSVAATTSGSALFLEPITRDFACNALYYCPLNHVVIDPCGSGVADACAKRLSIPVEPALWERWLCGNPTKLFRFWKMVSKGYTPASDVAEFVAAAAAALMGSHELTASDCRTYVLNAYRGKAAKFAEFRKAVAQHMGAAFADQWFPAAIAP
jgi:hypothetical protein